MALGSGLSFIFDTSKGETPQSIARKRALAAMIMGQIGNRPARNEGEGIGNALASIGQGIQTNVLNRRADKAETAGQESGNAAWNSLAAAYGGAGAFPAAPGASSPQASADPTDVPTQRVAQAFGDGQDGFIQSILPKAMEASKATGVDPRIIVAQAALESGYGKHAPGNNLFGIKGGNGPALATKEVVNGQPVDTTAQFQQFADPAASVQGYADFINKNPRYQPLKQAQGLDAQLEALGASGYATDPAYAAKVGSIARGIQLPQTATGAADALAAGQTPAPPMGAPQNVPDMPIAGKPSQQPVQVAQAANTGTPGQMSDADALQALGASPVTRNAQGGPSVQMLLQAASNPFLMADKGRAAVIQMMLKQQLDPSAGLDTELKRAQIDNIQSMVHLRNDPNARNRFGNSVIWGQDADGNWVAMQPTSAGGLVPAQVPEGVKLSPPGASNLNLGTQFGIRDRNGQIVNTIPIDNSGKAAATAEGTAQGAAAFDLPRVEQNAEQTLGILERMKSHPGREGSTGFVEGMLPSRTPAQVDFQSLVDQTQGQSFLQAFQMLKGGGQITEVEGQKATDAISRLRNQRLSDADYLRAITDLEDVVKKGLARARKQAGASAPASAPAAPNSGGVVDYRDYFGGQ